MTKEVRPPVTTAKPIGKVTLGVRQPAEELPRASQNRAYSVITENGMQLGPMLWLAIGFFPA
jgi:hypothetical protein